MIVTALFLGVLCLCVFLLIVYVPVIIFQSCPDGLSGFDQYLAEDRVYFSRTQRNATAESVIASPLKFCY